MHGDGDDDRRGRRAALVPIGIILVDPCAEDRALQLSRGSPSPMQPEDVDRIGAVANGARPAWQSLAWLMREQRAHATGLEGLHAKVAVRVWAITTRTPSTPSRKRTTDGDEAAAGRHWRTVLGHVRTDREAWENPFTDAPARLFWHTELVRRHVWGC